MSDNQLLTIMDITESGDLKLRWLPAQKIGFVLMIIPVILGPTAFLSPDGASNSLASFIPTILLIILSVIFLLAGAIMSIFPVHINRGWLCRKFACSKCGYRSHAPINKKKVKTEFLKDYWLLNSILGLISLSSENEAQSHDGFKLYKVLYVLKCSNCGQLSQHNYRYLKGGSFERLG